MSGLNNVGHFSRLGYDAVAIRDSVQESTAPLFYRMNSNFNDNCNACLSTFGPRPSGGANSFGVSTVPTSAHAPAQQLTDIESILTNRNVISSKSKDGQVNDIDVSKFKLQHARTCNDFLDPISTHLTDPASNYRGMAINRFFNLPKDPQANIFYDWSVNTKLEAIDNYQVRVPRVSNCDRSLPVERR